MGGVQHGWLIVPSATTIAENDLRALELVVCAHASRRAAVVPLRADLMRIVVCGFVAACKSSFWYRPCCRK